MLAKTLTFSPTVMRPALPRCYLLVTQCPLATIHRDLIITLAARHKLPAVYPVRDYVRGGGLMSNSASLAEQDQDRLAAGYVDRILKGEKPTDLPVQEPTKYEFNLKTAKVLGLDVPATLLARADEVIELQFVHAICCTCSGLQLAHGRREIDVRDYGEFWRVWKSWRVSGPPCQRLQRFHPR